VSTRFWAEAGNLATKGLQSVTGICGIGKRRGKGFREM